jgi:hypothetical protein
MTTEAQIEANRINAQKSTGPRTPEGKAKVSQNALKHGLLARHAVIIGEDLDDFDLFRDQFRAELAPVGIAESRLVERIVGLSWRLQRAERFGTEAFDTMYVQCDSDPQSKRWRSLPKPEGADPIFGRTVVKDFSETRVLERALVYERRIENSLYRTMAELRQVQERRLGAAEAPLGDRRARRSREQEDRRAPFHRAPETLPSDFTLDDLLAKIATSEEEPQTREDAFGNPDEPGGGTTNTPVAEGQSCETNPISPLQIAGTAPGNRRPPSAELSDCGLSTNLRRDALCHLPPRPRRANRATTPRCPVSFRQQSQFRTKSQV